MCVKFGVYWNVGVDVMLFDVWYVNGIGNYGNCVVGVLCFVFVGDFGYVVLGVLGLMFGVDVKFIGVMLLCVVGGFDVLGFFVVNVGVCYLM